MPGSPSQAGSKPGDGYANASTVKLVASRGRGGSNPPPGAIYIHLATHRVADKANVFK